ncbi:MAG: hypothetical protein OXF96_03025, partial [Chloroflexi bacterium]|nr:hypothetical protein [Chloroflexota bacterium]
MTQRHGPTDGSPVVSGAPSRYPAAAAHDRRTAASPEAMTMYRAGIVGLGVGRRHAGADTGSAA